ncbi:type II toxin-antitoxin system RelE/ParE family toxin [Nisaea sp.]|uniref:type II toxin-antitoxin system RelE family toxin n=1 Tax=Nisaea sp. TaxID=2024842 RepID=UPI0032EB5D70
MSEIQYTTTALKQMRKLAPEIRERLRSKISEYAETGKGDVKAMQGEPVFRLRVGDYRVVFSDSPAGISILRAGHRRDIYR